MQKALVIIYFHTGIGGWSEAGRSASVKSRCTICGQVADITASAFAAEHTHRQEAYHDWGNVYYRAGISQILEFHYKSSKNFKFYFGILSFSGGGLVTRRAPSSWPQLEHLNVRGLLLVC